MWSGFFFNTEDTYFLGSKGIPKRKHINYKEALRLMAEHLLPFSVTNEVVNELAGEIREKFCKMDPIRRAKKAQKFSYVKPLPELVGLLTTANYQFRSRESFSDSGMSFRESLEVPDVTR